MELDAKFEDVMENIAIIRSDFIDLFQNVKNKIRDLNTGCSAILNECTDCLYIIIIDKEKLGHYQLTPKNMEWTYFKYISAVTLFKSFSTGESEIYNICSSNYNYFLTILDMIGKHATKTSMWVATALNNKDWESIMKVLIQFGFKNPIIIDNGKSPGGTPITFPSIALVLDGKTKNIQNEITLKYLKFLRERFIIKKGLCQETNLTISGSDITLIRKVLLGWEYDCAGELVVCNNQKLLCLQGKTVIFGDEENKKVYPDINGFITWTTHKNESEIDFGEIAKMFVLSFSTGTMGHFIFTPKNACFIRFSTDMAVVMKLLSNENEVINYFAEKSKEKFASPSLESFVEKCKKTKLSEISKSFSENYNSNYHFISVFIEKWTSNISTKGLKTFSINGSCEFPTTKVEKLIIPFKHIPLHKEISNRVINCGLS